MTLWTNNPATLSLSNGTDITTANSAAPDSWSSVQKGANSTVKFQSGEIHMVAPAGTNEYTQLRRSNISFARLSVEAEFSGTAAPDVESRLFEFRNSLGAAARINVGTDNKLRILSSGNALLHTFTTALPSSAGWRIYAGVKPGTTSSNGSIHVRLYLANDGKGTTVAESWEFDNRDAGTSNITELRLGWSSDASWSLRYRNIRMEDATLAPIGPLVTDPPVVTAPVERFESVVDFTGKVTSAATPVVMTAARLSGWTGIGTITIDGYVARYNSTQQTEPVTIRFTFTDANGLTTTHDEEIIPAPSSSGSGTARWIAKDGAWT